MPVWPTPGAERLYGQLQVLNAFLANLGDQPRGKLMKRSANLLRWPLYVTGKTCPDEDNAMYRFGQQAVQIPGSIQPPFTGSFPT